MPSDQMQHLSPFPPNFFLLVHWVSFIFLSYFCRSIPSHSLKNFWRPSPSSLSLLLISKILLRSLFFFYICVNVRVRVCVEQQRVADVLMCVCVLSSNMWQCVHVHARVCVEQQHVAEVLMCMRVCVLSSNVWQKC